MVTFHRISVRRVSPANAFGGIRVGQVSRTRGKFHIGQSHPKNRELFAREARKMTDLVRAVGVSAATAAEHYTCILTGHHKFRLKIRLPQILGTAERTGPAILIRLRNKLQVCARLFQHRRVFWEAWVCHYRLFRECRPTVIGHE